MAKEKIKILYIDDYDLDRELVKDALEKEHGGFEVTEACNRQEFESLLKTQTFDVVLSDFNIAGFEGLQVLYRVRRHDPRIPVIIVTGTGSEEIAVMALKRGASDYVIKRPVHIRKLPQTIFAAIEKQALREQREQAQVERERLMSAVEHVGEMVVITDINGTIQYANPAFADITGYGVQEAIGQNPRILKSGQHPAMFYQMLWNTLLSGKRWAGRLINKRKDGALYTAECSVSPVMDPAGIIVNFVWIARDVTEKIELERMLQQSQKLEAIGNLAGGIAHDFNNILSSIIGFTELSLDHVEKNSIIEDNLQEIYTAGKRAKELVRQILAFSRQSDREVKPVQVGKIVDEVLKLVRSTLPVTIDIKQKTGSDSLIMGDATQIYQILMNLCTNAAHAMENMDGVLEVSLNDMAIDNGSGMHLMDLKPGNYIKIKVSDTGVGISPDIIDLIFDPYFTTKGPVEGTGMGLALVRSIVESYGGKIVVDSTLGKGSTFMIFLPTVTTGRISHHPYEPQKLPFGSERILFVDDEVPIAKIGRLILRQLGYSVETRTCAVDALTLLRSRPDDFDLVITDMTMPNMSGGRLAIELSKIRAEIPVILCTGYSKNISDDLVAQKNVKAIIYKPIVKAELATIIRNVLDDRVFTGAGERILLIDDDEALLRSYSMILTERGYEIQSFRDPIEALAAFKDKPHHCDLVITDLSMPKMAGDKLAQYLLNIRPGLPIVLLTGRDEKIAKTEASTTGIKKYGSKPIGKKELSKLVHDVLKNQD